MKPLPKNALLHASDVREYADTARRRAVDAHEYRSHSPYYADFMSHGAAQRAHDARMAATNARKEGWHGTFV